MLALTGCTGKLGSATLSALIKHNLIPPTSLIILTSTPSSPSLTPYRDLGITIRPSNYTNPTPASFTSCTALFLVSSTAITLDFNSAPSGHGREKHHIATIDAAVQAGVKHIYYTSLAFGSDSQAGVMRAHLRTEAYLAGLERDGVIKSTILRQGLYSESWPLDLGYYDLEGGDAREEIVIAGDGRIPSTAIADLGVANAVVLADPGERWEGKTVYLVNPGNARSLKEMAGLVGEARGRRLGVKVVGRREFEDYYVERGEGREGVEWWSSAYDAFARGECDVKDGTLEELLQRVGVKPKSFEDTLREMLRK